MLKATLVSLTNQSQAKERLLIYTTMGAIAYSHHSKSTASTVSDEKCRSIASKKLLSKKQIKVIRKEKKRVTFKEECEVFYPKDEDSIDNVISSEDNASYEDSGDKLVGFSDELKPSEPLKEEGALLHILQSESFVKWPDEKDLLDTTTQPPKLFVLPCLQHMYHLAGLGLPCVSKGECIYQHLDVCSSAGLCVADPLAYLLQFEVLDSSRGYAKAF